MDLDAGSISHGDPIVFRNVAADSYGLGRNGAALHVDLSKTLCCIATCTLRAVAGCKSQFNEFTDNELSRSMNLQIPLTHAVAFMALIAGPYFFCLDPAAVKKKSPPDGGIGIGTLRWAIDCQKDGVNLHVNFSPPQIQSPSVAAANSRFLVGVDSDGQQTHG